MRDSLVGPRLTVDGVVLRGAGAASELALQVQAFRVLSEVSSVAAPRFLLWGATTSAIFLQVLAAEVNIAFPRRSSWCTGGGAAPADAGKSAV